MYLSNGGLGTTSLARGGRRLKNQTKEKKTVSPVSEKNFWSKGNKKKRSCRMLVGGFQSLEFQGRETQDEMDKN